MRKDEFILKNITSLAQFFIKVQDFFFFLLGFAVVVWNNLSVLGMDDNKVLL